MNSLPTKIGSFTANAHQSNKSKTSRVVVLNLCSVSRVWLYFVVLGEKKIIQNNSSTHLNYCPLSHLREHAVWCQAALSAEVWQIMTSLPLWYPQLGRRPLIDLPFQWLTHCKPWPYWTHKMQWGLGSISGSEEGTYFPTMPGVVEHLQVESLLTWQK